MLLFFLLFGLRSFPKNSATICLVGTDTYEQDPQQISKAKVIQYQYAIYPGEDITKKINENLFIKVELSKSVAYENEVITASYQLYSRLVDNTEITRLPNLENFKFYSLEKEQELQSHVAEINGKNFKVKTLKQFQIIPDASGKLIIDPILASAKVEMIPKAGRKDDATSLEGLMNEIHGEETTAPIIKIVELKSESRSVFIRPLPAGNKPDNFDARRVGKFTLFDSLAKGSVNGDEINSLYVTVAGSGWVSGIDSIDIVWPPDVEIVKVNTSETIDKQLKYMNASKTFEYLFFLRKKGKNQIQVSLDYFNTEKERYERIERVPLLITCLSDGENSEKSVKNIPEKPTLEQTKSSTKRLSYVLALFVVGLVIFSRLRKKKRVNKLRKEEERIAEERRTEASEERSDIFFEVRECITTNDRQKFFSALYNSIFHHLSKLVEQQTTIINKEMLFENLRNKGISDSSINTLHGILTTCETNLYVSINESVNLSDELQKAENFIKRIETEIEVNT